MKDISLVIMAAGLGTRYGGQKQTDGIGPNGEILMEYSIYDAAQAGFTKIVFIIRREMEPAFAHMQLPKRLDGAPLQVSCQIQDFSGLPDFYHLPPERTRPFGTAHALLCAAPAVDEPFCVINADDYYGPEAYRLMADTLRSLPSAQAGAMVGYPLKNTASLYGSVSRGLCTVQDGYLSSVREARKIQLYPDGSLKNLEDGQLLDPNAIISMNMWGFSPDIFQPLRQYFEDFLQAEGGADPSAECMLPAMIQRQIDRGQLRVRVLSTDSQWFGITYREDRAAVAAALRSLHETGVYPLSLHP